MEELSCNELIYWDATSIKYQYIANEILILTRNSVAQGPKDNEGQLVELTLTIFDELKETLTNNILLKAHHYFLVIL